MDFEETEMIRPNILIGSLFRQAIKTFCPMNPLNGEFSSSFRQLKSILDKIRADHVKLDPVLNDDTVWENEDKAPCTYIEIFENQNFNMSIFVLKPGFKMPLHDHPHMYGLLKVISGTVRIKSFSKIQSETTIQQTSENPNSHLSPKPFLAEISDYKLCDAETECCVLTPEESNFHEIEAVDGPSAFLDILAPPYSTYIQDEKIRVCRYYKVLQEIDSNTAQLEEIPPPKWFYCDQAPYLGPVLI